MLFSFGRTVVENKLLALFSMWARDLGLFSISPECNSFLARSCPECFFPNLLVWWTFKKNLLISIDIFLNVFIEFTEFNDKNISHYIKRVQTCHFLCERPICYHNASKAHVNAIRFPEFTEFNESCTPFRKNSNISLVSFPVKYWFTNSHCNYNFAPPGIKSATHNQTSFYSIWRDSHLIRWDSRIGQNHRCMN